MIHPIGHLTSRHVTSDELFMERSIYVYLAGLQGIYAMAKFQLGIKASKQDGKSAR